MTYRFEHKCTAIAPRTRYRGIVSRCKCLDRECLTVRSGAIIIIITIVSITLIGGSTLNVVCRGVHEVQSGIKIAVTVRKCDCLLNRIGKCDVYCCSCRGDIHCPLLVASDRPDLQCDSNVTAVRGHIGVEPIGGQNGNQYDTSAQTTTDRNQSVTIDSQIQ